MDLLLSVEWWLEFIALSLSHFFSITILIILLIYEDVYLMLLFSHAIRIHHRHIIAISDREPVSAWNKPLCGVFSTFIVDYTLYRMGERLPIVDRRAGSSITMDAWPKLTENIYIYAYEWPQNGMRSISSSLLSSYIPLWKNETDEKKIDQMKMMK